MITKNTNTNNARICEQKKHKMGMETQLIKFKEDERGFIKIYNVQYNNKTDRVYFYFNEWGIGFELYYGNFTETEFSDIEKSLFEDAYYVRYDFEIGSEIKPLYFFYEV